MAEDPSQHPDIMRHSLYIEAEARSIIEKLKLDDEEDDDDEVGIML